MCLYLWRGIGICKSGVSKQSEEGIRFYRVGVTGVFDLVEVVLGTKLESSIRAGSRVFPSSILCRVGLVERFF